jgi:hypothetical protein
MPHLNPEELLTELGRAVELARAGLERPLKSPGPPGRYNYAGGNVPPVKPLPC